MSENPLRHAMMKPESPAVWENWKSRREADCLTPLAEGEDEVIALHHEIWCRTLQTDDI